MDFELLRGSWKRVLKTRKFRSGGGVIINPLERKFRGGGGVRIKMSSVGGVWIFSGTTHLRRDSEWRGVLQLSLYNSRTGTPLVVVLCPGCFLINVK